MHAGKATRRYLLVSLGLAGGCGPDAPARNVASLTGPRTVALETVATLADAGRRILASPITVSERADGSIIIADGSDNDVKIYTPAGLQVQSLGGPGRGPGEFQSLHAAQPYRDSVAAFDFLGGRISVFDADGTFARAFTVPPGEWAGAFSFRVADDSLLLMIGSPLRYPRRDLLALLHPDGRMVATMFNAANYFKGDRALAQESFVLADAADGVVFAGLAGGDSLFAFDYTGRRLAAARIETDGPLVSLRERMRANGGRLRRPNGDYVHHLDPMLFQVVALDSGAVALHVSPYDTKRGNDLVEGGTLLVYALQPDGRLEQIAREEVNAGLFGRSRSGRAMLLSYSSPSADEYRLHTVQLGRTDEK
jgi:hypothetical protein